MGGQASSPVKVQLGNCTYHSHGVLIQDSLDARKAGKCSSCSGQPCRLQSSKLKMGSPMSMTKGRLKIIKAFSSLCLCMLYQ